MHISELLTLIGALGLFIYGMMVMSDGIQKLAGTRMQSILGSITSNRFKGIFTGFMTTTLIQSSSATTVMIVSFVNAGLLNLRQAISVIMGANIGTTMTAWLLVIFGFSKFSLGHYVFPILAVGVPLLFFSKGTIKNLGEFLVGFALLFLGLSGMKDAVEGLNLGQNQGFLDMISFLKDQGFGGVLILVFVGTILTIVVQSSSAAMALTLSLCGSVVGLPFEMAAAIVLGENIGTTVTANLAALVGNVHAKRAARAHFIFNIFGVVWMLLIFFSFTRGIGWLMEQTKWGSPFVQGDVNPTEESIRYSLSAFHTVFNIVNTLVLVWFLSLIEKTVIRLTPSKGEDDEIFKLEYIAGGITSTPELSLLEAKKEVAKFGEITFKMHNKAKDLVNESDSKKRDKLIKKIAKYEDITDRLETEIANYLGNVSASKLSEESSSELRSMLSITNDLERIGDIYFEIAKAIEKKSENKLWFDQKQRDNLNDLLKEVEVAFDQMMDNLNGKYSEIDMDKARTLENSINEMRNKIRKKHLKSMEKKEYNAQSGLVYSNIFSSIERVGDHIINVSEAASGINLN